MSSFIELLVILGAVGAVAYWRLSVTAWAGTIGGVLLLLTLVTHMSWWLLIPCWLIFAVAAGIFLSPNLREHAFMRKTFNLFKKLLPPISQTEQEALDAGDTWWEADLFRGQPDWQKLHAVAKPTLTDEEQAFIDNQVMTLCSMVDDWKIVQEERDLPAAVWDYLKKEGFFGLVIDKKYGGRGFSALAHSTIISSLASRSISVAVDVMVPNSLGPAELLCHYGTEAQKDHYLPKLAKGEEIPCFCLTGPDAGSDAGAMTDIGIVCRGMHEGKEVVGIRLSWDKRYITMAPMATLLGVAFKLYDPNHFLGDKEEVGITLALVPSTHPGVEVSKRHFPAGMAFLNGPVRGNDVFIPMDWIIGGQAMVGHGWRMLMECLAMGRGISLPAISTAVGAVSYRMTGAYSRIRKQFKTAIANFEGVEESLARICGNAYMLEATRVMTAGAVDLKIKPSVTTAIAKYHMTEISRQVMNDTMDIHGGRGIQMGPRNYLAHGHCALPISITVEGANILTRNLIIFGQGAMRCHPFIRQEMAAANDANVEQGYAQFDKLLCAHMGYTASNLVRTFVYGVTGGFFIKAPTKNKKLARCYKQLTRMSTALASVSDIAMMMLGGDLKRKERLSARLGDVLSNLYLASSVLKYYQDQGQLEEDIPYVEWCVQTCLHRIQKAFDDFFANFSRPWLGTLLSLIVFPIDHSYKQGPSDKLDHAIVQPMLINSGLRQRLSKLSVAFMKPDDIMGRVELAFQQVLQTAELEKILHRAVRDGKLPNQPTRQALLETAVATGILTGAQAQQLIEVDVAVADAIAVDEFRYEQLTGKSPSWSKKAQKVTETV